MSKFLLNVFYFLIFFDRSRNRQTEEGEDFDGFQSQEEVEREKVEERASKTPASIEDKADDNDDKSVCSDNNPDDYHQSPSTSNLKPLTVSKNRITNKV